MGEWKRTNLLIILLLVFSTLGLSQGVWKKSGTVEFPMPVEDLCLLPQADRTIQAIVRNGENLEHWTRGSQSPFPWIKQADIPGKYKGSGTILLYADGNYLIGWPLVTDPGQPGEMETWWSRPSEWPDPSKPIPPPPPPPPPPDKHLSVEDGKIYYGDDEITLCGVSRREALWRSTGEYDPMGGWGSDYSLQEYESDIEDSGINYVRHLGIKDTHFMIDHIKRMKDIEVIVEIEVYDAYKGNYGILVDIDSMGEVAEIGNVFFDCANEFLDYEPAINIVIDLCGRLKAQGCLVSAGAWSGEQGYDLSTVFHNRYSDYDIESTHREWNVETWNDALSYGKPVTFSEYFSQGNLTLQEVKDLMKTAFDMGLSVQYYGFRFDKIPGLSVYDPFDYKSILNYAGQLLIH